MKERYGILLIDKGVCIVRIYEVNFRSWKLQHYVEFDIKIGDHLNIDKVSQVFVEFITSSQAQHITEWKVTARSTDERIVHVVKQIMSLDIEILSPAREQELLSKGMFTELLLLQTV